MALNYDVQKPHLVRGTKSGDTLTGVALTTSYVAGRVIDIEGASKVAIYVSYTSAGAGNSIQLRLRTRPVLDDTNEYQLVNESASGGTSTLTLKELTYETSGNGNTDNFVFLLDIADGALEIAAKETVAAGSAGTASIEVATAGK